MLCEVCEYARFGENSSRKPKKTTKERKKSTKSTEAEDENTPGNSSSQLSNDGEKSGEKIRTEETLADAFECKFCTSTSTDDKLLQCDRCDFGVCLPCSTMSSVLYELMNKNSQGVHWFCKECDSQAMKDVQTGQQIEERCKFYFNKCRDEIKEVESTLNNKIDTEVARLDSEVKALKSLSASQRTKNVELSKKVDELEQEMNVGATVVEQKIEERTTNIAQKSISEILEREKRRNQLILFNIMESDKEEAKQRQEDDSKEICRILESINAASDIDQVIRVGQKQTTPRPIKIKLKNQSNKDRILKAAMNLKGTEIYISKDMTPLEQAEHRKLVMELKKKRGEAGVDDQWVIRRGRVMNASRTGRKEVEDTSHDPSKDLHPRK